MVFVPKLPALSLTSSVAKLLQSNLLHISLHTSSLGLFTVVKSSRSDKFYNLPDLFDLWESNGSIVLLFEIWVIVLFVTLYLKQ